jgi:hypothetical protein
LPLFARWLTAPRREQREDQDLQDVVGRHRVEGVLGEDVKDELIEIELCNFANFFGTSPANIHTDTRLEKVDHQQAQTD